MPTDRMEGGEAQTIRTIHLMSAPTLPVKACINGISLNQVLILLTQQLVSIKRDRQSNLIKSEIKEDSIFTAAEKQLSLLKLIRLFQSK